MSYSEANVRLCRYAVHFRALPSSIVSDVPPMWSQDDQREVRSSAEQLEESIHLLTPSRPHTCHYVVRLSSDDPERAVFGFARIHVYAFDAVPVACLAYWHPVVISGPL